MSTYMCLCIRFNVRHTGAGTAREYLAVRLCGNAERCCLVLVLLQRAEVEKLIRIPLEVDKMSNRMEGLSIAGMKRHPMLIPLFFCIGAGAIGSGLYMARCALRSPDVTWTPKKNSEPWNDYKDKQYKFRSPHYGQEQKSPAPTY